MARVDLVLLLVSVALRVGRCEIIFPCDWDEHCEWKWTENENGLRKITGQQTDPKYTGPKTDANGDVDGTFLYLPGFHKPPSHFFNVSSPWLNSSESCHLIFSEHSKSADKDAIKVIRVSHNMPLQFDGHYARSQNSWRTVDILLGRITSPFQVIIEFIPSNNSNSHVAIDNLRLENCFADTKPAAVECSGQSHFECGDKTCVNKSRVCDLQFDCPTGEDEGEICEKIPSHARCNFETVGDEMCGWSNDQNDELEWFRKRDGRDRRGPEFDNTYKNSSGHYLLFQSQMRAVLGNVASINSVTFNPPPEYHGQIHSPYYNSCQIRFYYFMASSGADLTLNCIETPPGKDVKEIKLWRIYGKKEEKWSRVVVPLPRVVTKFHVQFMGKRGLSNRGYIAIDDISLSPECFGIGVPENLTQPSRKNVIKNNMNTKNSLFPHTYTVYHFNTCGARGRFGPTNSMCEKRYASSNISVTIASEGNMSGIQSWTVNKSGIYSVIARGASGGKGARDVGKSHGAIARGVFNWTTGDVIYLLIGQQGSSSCQWTHCAQRPSGIRRLAHLKMPASNEGSGGGGGGATFMFQMDDVNRPIPLLVAAGGGGFSLDPAPEHDFDNPDGGLDNKSALPYNGRGPYNGAGGGGGWSNVVESNLTEFPSGGLSLMEGGVGGKPCSALINWEASGGFGGGGGACQSGGGGGGYAGGNAADPDHSEKNGLGGVSFVSGAHAFVGNVKAEGAGSVDILPAIEGCGCSFLCVILDPDEFVYTCICQDKWQLADDNVSCEAIPGMFQTDVLGMPRHLLIILLCVVVILICIGTATFFLYHRYRRQKMKTLRQELFGNAELQLNRLRQHTGGMITEYNPNYEFGGSTCTIQDLKEIPRDSLNLIKPLGQGAFGEVYQGSLTNLPDEARDLPVAVKTLPELSSAQAEMDFLMEALIMSKFNHPNIVRFIGVCFEKLPKFIVLELLPGGDLKSFLREQRPKPDRPSPLTMCDLLLLAIDVARGCRYLEENHFIHRDIAARNCLLSSKDANRVVKIADFGMARDIYRADYYRKGGKAMLPVKWMPPEAFLDGIFTSKTDVWSFGVLLWEVMSLGYMPYPGRGNQEVMQLVTSGGRLEPPNNCPSPVYHIMVQCWNSIPDDRPNFVTILERLGYCLQDPDVISAALPVFHRPPSMERDATVMRPPDSEDRFLQVQRPSDSEPMSPSSTDYLIPIPASNYSLSTEKTDLASSIDSIDKLLELDDHRVPAPPAPSPVVPANAKKRSGGYTSIPATEDTIPNNQTDVWQRAPVNNAKTPLPLDASMLGKQQNALPFPYMNVSVAAKAPPLDQKIDPFIIGNHYTEKEVNC